MKDPYVTVDLDDPTIWEINAAWNRVGMIAREGPFGRVSSSGNGVHIRTHDTLPEHVPVNAHLREWCGDDPVRIKGDIRNAIEQNQVLYDRKGAVEAGEWYTDVGELIMEYMR